PAAGSPERRYGAFLCQQFVNPNNANVAVAAPRGGRSGERPRPAQSLGRGPSLSRGNMRYRFHAAEWGRLTAKERATRCRLLAHEASELGRTAKTKDARRIYLELAAQWEKLAREIESEITQFGPQAA